MSNSQDDAEFKAFHRQLVTTTNDDFMNYFKKYEKIKEKWVFCFMKNEQKRFRTNMAIESWHKTLKYHYLQGKKNRRVDLLIFNLIRMDTDKSYQINLRTTKGKLNTLNIRINERHNFGIKAKMNIIDQNKVQVIIDALENIFYKFNFFLVDFSRH